MSDWQQLCRGATDIQVVGHALEVTFRNARKHTVSVYDQADTIELTAIVARAAVLEGVPEVALRAWRRNRSTSLVGFRIDGRGRLLGEAWVPKTGLSRDEFQLYVRRVAAESDLFEYHLTAKDQE